MESKGIEVRLLLVLLAIIIFSGGAMAQPGCTNVILTMASCLNYVTGASPTPPATCCSALANVVQTNPRCLCAVLDGGENLGVKINATLALSLPTVCKVKTPPASRCNAANGTAISPVGSSETSPGPTGSSDSSSTPSVTGSKATPGSATPSKGNVTTIHLQLVGFLVLLVSSFLSKFSCI